MADRKLEVYKDAETVARAAAQRTLLAILDGLSEQDSSAGAETKPVRSRYDVALTGGSDILRALTYMASNPLVDAIDFSRVHFWWGDDRFVAATDEDRSSWQARERFLNKLVADGRLPESNIHEMAVDTRTPEEVAAASDAQNDELLAKAAADYENDLRRELGDEPAMDLLILGMGPDGHFASLFPDHDGIKVTDPARLAVGVSHSPKMPPLRISMTAPMLARTRRTWMLTCGAGKADATAHVFAQASNPAYPASFATGTEEFVWFTTPDAVAKL
ncbi:6-phosphogluconolactonase [Bifidobacterium sp. ESL0690]|uniref:6-phosphogluconolactonase n=1 Tax=Bifidobacterium sp. ESL0690 TaxID=2983214 RepID=UPI0023F7053A|nr:6-phosphogluconolactonase [Bifidobacterium sp. ESL0690]WEV46626.1 6-phosphogluconolactonase [Bifidobacterium sp. ESL0690]